MSQARSYLGLRGTNLNVAIGFIAGLDFLLFGYDQGVLGSLLTLRSWIERFPSIDTTDEIHPEYKGNYHHSVIQGIMTASYNLGCFVGAIVCIFVGNTLGRRRTIFLGSAIMVVGAIIQCTPFKLGQLIAARVITGVGNGLNTSTVPTWQSECSKSHRRGQLVMMEGSLITAGITISYWIDFGMHFVDPNSASWRFPIAFQIFFALIILGFVMFLPESPRWLIFKGYEDEATEVLSAILDKPADDPYVRSEFTAIKDTVLLTEGVAFRDLFTMDENRHFHRVVLAYVNQMFQQISGINLITYYAANIFQEYLRMSSFLSRLLAALNGTEYFIASLLPIFIVERVGRRPLMLIGAAGMCVGMVALAICVHFAENNTHAAAAAAFFLFFFNTFFAWGWLGMTWLYPAEIVPLRIRAPANALSTSANWLFNFTVVMISPPAFTHIGYKTYIIFAVINFVIFPVVYFFYPETAYRSLEEMDTIFHKTTSIFDLVRVAREEPRRYGKNGELLINYEETDEHRRRFSHVSEEKVSRAHKAVSPDDHVEHSKNSHVEHATGSDSSV